MASALLVLAAAAAPAFVSALNNGQAVTPRMGWNPYNAFSCDTTEAQYHTQTDALVSSGLAALGYTYMITDCGWQGTKRAADGSFTWDTMRLPAGMPNLASYVHARGLKFGVYSDAGYFSCDNRNGQAGWMGSLNHEAQDAATFAAWGADYLKYDNCFSDSPTTFVNHNPSIDLRPHFTAMRDALAKVNRSIVYGLCEWGVQDPARWAAPVGNSWRMSDDISASWSSVLRIINELVPITGFAGPGGWNDMDLLEVGQSALTLAEQQTHFAFWAAAKSPLLISTDLTKLSAGSMAILNNTRIIALNQDVLGKSIAFKRRYTDDHDVWAGPLADGSTVALIINWQNARRSVTFNLADVGFTSVSAQNLVTGASLGTLSTSYLHVNSRRAWCARAQAHQRSSSRSSRVHLVHGRQLHTLRRRLLAHIQLERCRWFHWLGRGCDYHRRRRRGERRDQVTCLRLHQRGSRLPRRGREWLPQLSRHAYKRERRRNSEG
ncbi:glycoside hydrolase [Exidia glandulosa HHB12029]|uniref:Alpha-galactosidase n=1 Tax=Exidia glandulosa HHB12029 TaxID=1314781 RepID=A0A166AMP2_EXIGL|nr:glycoside hydrolase [Exidia glandulosa HHB12029]